MPASLMQVSSYSQAGSECATIAHSANRRAWLPFNRALRRPTMPLLSLVCVGWLHVAPARDTQPDVAHASLWRFIKRPKVLALLVALNVSRQGRRESVAG